MNFLTSNEKKALYVLAGISVLAILEYTVFDFRIISSSIEDFLSLIVLGFIGIYILTQPKAHQKVKDRLVGYYAVWLLACAAIYLVIYFGCGFFFGFGRNPFDRSLTGILRNVFFFGGAIALKEWIRNFVINKAEKKTVLLYGMIIVVLYTLIEVNILDLISSSSVEEFTIILCEKILPVLTLNIFLTYVCYIAGSIPSIIYMLATSVPIWFFENLPNLEWIVVAVLGVAFPLIALLALMETVNNVSKKKAVKIKNHPKTINFVVWIFVIGFCLVAAFFTAGLLNTFPTVLVSGSMSPTINRGDVVVIKKIDEDTEIFVGDVVIFNAGEYDVVHRVVDIYYEDGTKKFVTKGDANENIDNLSIEHKNIGGVVVATIPYIGLPRLLIESAEYEKEINGT
ncbi:MAG: signal peptidase I [Eubacteriales bacterium]